MPYEDERRLAPLSEEPNERIDLQKAFKGADEERMGAVRAEAVSSHTQHCIAGDVPPSPIPNPTESPARHEQTSVEKAACKQSLKVNWSGEGFAIGYCEEVLADTSSFQEESIGGLSDCLLASISYADQSSLRGVPDPLAEEETGNDMDTNVLGDKSKALTRIQLEEEEEDEDEEEEIVVKVGQCDRGDFEIPNQISTTTEHKAFGTTEW